MIKRLLKFLSTSEQQTPGKMPVVIPGDQHSISSKDISLNALKVMNRLNSSGFESYLVGGGVRDLLLGGAPKDFDVATNATPEQIKLLFRNARIIGRRFRIVHVRFGREVIEVTTFRGQHSGSSHQVESDSGQLLRDNVYGDMESDAMRRDFTANALYYSSEDFSIYEYTTGLEDIQSRQLRMIGDPATRYREDPVRLLRAVRLAAKLGFSIEEKTVAPIPSLAGLLAHVPPARLFDEILKLFLAGYATATFALLRAQQLAAQLFPDTWEVMDAKAEYRLLIEAVMINTDKRVHSGKRVTPAFICAAILWPAMKERYNQLRRDHQHNDAFHKACQWLINRQLQRVMIPKRFLIPMRQIWELQWRLPNRRGNRAHSLMDHPKFRAAYDFLLLREQAGEELENLGQWWTRFQDVDQVSRGEMIGQLQPPTGKKGRRRTRRKQADHPELKDSNNQSE